MAVADRIDSADAARGTGGPARKADAGGPLLAAGGVLAALGASSCCVVPLLLFMMGVGGAWIGNLTALAPYQPAFVAAALAFLAAGVLYLRRRQNAAACAAEGPCARTGSDRIARLGLWTGAVLVAATAAFPYAAPLLLSP